MGGMPTATLDTRDRPRWSGKAAAERAGITYRQLDYWLRTGVCRSAVEANGSGSRRRLTDRDVAVVQMVARLRELGVPLDTCRDVAATLIDRPESWSGHVLVTEQGEVIDGAEVALGMHGGVSGYLVWLDLERCG